MDNVVMDQCDVVGVSITEEQLRNREMPKCRGLILVREDKSQSMARGSASTVDELVVKYDDGDILLVRVSSVRNEQICQRVFANLREFDERLGASYEKRLKWCLGDSAQKESKVEGRKKKRRG